MLGKERWREFFAEDEMNVLLPEDVERIKREVPELVNAHTNSIVRAWIKFSAEVANKQTREDLISPQAGTVKLVNVTSVWLDHFRGWLDLPV